jgi:hypothetical protein
MYSKVTTNFLIELSGSQQRNITFFWNLECGISHKFGEILKLKKTGLQKLHAGPGALGYR